MREQSKSIIRNIERRYGKSWKSIMGTETQQDIMDAEMFRAFMTAAMVSKDRPIGEIYEFITEIRSEVQESING